MLGGFLIFSVLLLRLFLQTVADSIHTVRRDETRQLHRTSTSAMCTADRGHKQSVVEQPAPRQRTDDNENALSLIDDENAF